MRRRERDTNPDMAGMRAVDTHHERAIDVALTDEHGSVIGHDENGRCMTACLQRQREPAGRARGVSYAPVGHKVGECTMK